MVGRQTVANPARRLVDLAVTEATLAVARSGGAVAPDGLAPVADTRQVEAVGTVGHAWPFMLGYDELGGEVAYLRVRGMDYGYGS